jgi:hypothetical protein
MSVTPSRRVAEQLSALRGSLDTRSAFARGFETVRAMDAISRTVRWRRRAKDVLADDGHQLRDNDVAAVPGYPTFREILNDETRELPVLDTDDPLRMTPGQEHRSGRRRWLP